MLSNHMNKKLRMLAGATFLAPLAFSGHSVSADEDQPDALKQEDSLKNKNLIVIKLDELRWDQLGYMDHPVVKTPHIDKLAGESHVFENNYTVSPLCTPSRASFFTGKYTMQHGCKFVDMPNHMKAHQWSYLNTLREAGYVIGLAGKNHCFNDEYMEKFFDYREEYTHFGKIHGEMIKKDKEIYEYRHTDPRPEFRGSTPDQGSGILGEGLIEGPMPFTEEEGMTYRIAEDGIKFLDKYKDSTFFLHYSFPDPHWPNVVPEPYFSMYDPDKLELEGLDINWQEHPFAHYVQSVSQGYDKYTVAERKRILATMYGQVTYCDKAIGMLLDKLDELNLRKKTVIVFTVDHGNFGGRYGLIGKTKAFYDALVRIPLVISMPGLEGGKRYQAQLENIDVMPTVMQYLGFEKPIGVKGESFLGIMKGEKPDKHREVIYSEVGLPGTPPPVMSKEEFMPYRKKRIEEDGTSWFLDYTTVGRSSMIKKDGWKYCFYINDREELYNCNEDPLELENLANNAEYAEKKAEMKKLWQEEILRKSMREITDIDY
jgi:arylsulfatase